MKERIGIQILLFYLAGVFPATPVFSQDNIPQISIEKSGSGLEIQFTGQLQTASDATGPWSDLAEATSPFLINASDPFRYFRSLERGSVFSSNSVLELALSGPFQQHFDLAFAGIPDGIFPPVREKPYFDGILQLAGKSIPVSIRVRGNSSLQECPFPKIKVKVSRSDREGTPFSDAREFKIGTHCAEGGSGNIGRLRHETATFREALVYEVMNLLGYVSPRVRRAQIVYRDTTSGDVSQESGWELSRMAFIYDHVEVVAEKLGGRALEDEEVANLSHADFNEQLLTELRLFHALAGNWDYQLSADGVGLWNTEVIEKPDGELVPVAGDFDLASWVTGKVRVSAPRDFLPDLGDLERQIRFEMGEIISQSKPELFQNAKNRYVSKQSELESLIQTAEIDDEGRNLAMEHVTVFFGVLNETKPR